MKTELEQFGDQFPSQRELEAAVKAINSKRPNGMKIGIRSFQSSDSESMGYIEYNPDGSAYRGVWYFAPLF